jgi:hemerythrin-like domain-containing protein
MCDYCDCRSHPEIASLSADHEVLLDLLADLQRSIVADDRAAATPTIAQLHDLLHHHGDREERGVFAELRHAGIDDDYVDTFERDHEDMHRLLDAHAEPGWITPASELVQVLARHITREESDLFPAAHQLLLPAQWDAVDDAIGPPVPTP